MRNVTVTSLLVLPIVGAVILAGCQPAPRVSTPGGSAQSQGSSAKRELPMITAASYEQTVEQAQMPVVLDFTASWCGPCQVMKPILEEVAAEYEGRVFVAMVDYDHEKELVQKYGVRGIPHLVFTRDGQQVDSMTGLPSFDADDIRQVLRERFEQLAR